MFLEACGLGREDQKTVVPNPVDAPNLASGQDTAAKDLFSLSVGQEGLQVREAKLFTFLDVLTADSAYKVNIVQWS